jgi:type IV secretion system protein VirB9
MKKTVVTVCILIGVSQAAFAELIPESISADHRIKIVTYDPNNVTLIKAHYDYETEILFDDNETVQNVSIGDSMAWQAVPVTNHLFIKPTAVSTTNMTILTNSRSYNFQLDSSNSSTPSDQIYELKFIYPDDVQQYQQSMISSSQNISPTQYNWKYSFTGDKQIAPLQAFDNGKFTYFKFRSDGNSSIPAIFSVDKNRNETLLNYHVEGDYIVVNRVANQFTLRNGKQVTCVYNDQAIGDWEKIR